MGFSQGTLFHLAWLRRAGKIPDRARLLDFGSQNFFGGCDISTMKQFVALFGREPPPDRMLSEIIENQSKIDTLMSAAGIRYTAFDVYSGGTTRKFDLNKQSLGWGDRAAYDVVMNCGTSEHVVNQYNVFEVAHNALKPAGVMLNFIPFYGQINHGFFTYHPKFFASLIINNGYEPLYWGLSDIFSGGDIDRYRDVSKAENGQMWEDKYVGCAEMSVIWQKKRRSGFHPPTDYDLPGQLPAGINYVIGEMADYRRFSR